MQTYILYADGACSGNPGPGGYAWDIYDAEIDASNPLKPLQSGQGGLKHTTNNVMEMMAARDALKSLLQAPKAGSEVIMRLDGQYVLKGLFEWLPGWKKRGWKAASGNPVANREIWEEIDTISLKLRAAGVKLVSSWVRGHNGDAGNERVDQRAVTVRDAYANGTEARIDLPATIKQVEFKPGDRAAHRKGGQYIVMRVGPLVCDGALEDEGMLGISLNSTGDILAGTPDPDLWAMVQMSTPIKNDAEEGWVLYMSLTGEIRAFLRPIEEFSDGRFKRKS